MICLSLALLVLPSCAARPSEADQPPPKAAQTPDAPEGQEEGTGALIVFDGVITPLRVAYLKRKLEAARESGVRVVVVEINSPGGGVEESFAAARMLQQITWARTVAYVPDMALSGGAVVALGCDDIVMGPNARLGDVGVIYQDDYAFFQYAPEKVRSDIALRMRALAEAKGRPPALAEAMVDMDLEVYRVVDASTNEAAYKTQAEIDADADPGRWQQKQPVFESRKEHFLEATGSRAVELELAQGVVHDREEVRQRYELASLRVVRRSGIDVAVAVLNSWPITFLLLLVGVSALYVEMSAPGISIGGLIAGLCFLALFWSRFLGGTCGWLEVILFVSGVIFLAVELFLLPGFGVAGVLGLLLILVSVVMAGQNYVLPSNERELVTTLRSLLVVLASGVAFVGVAMVASRYFGSIPVLNRLALKPPTSGTPGDSQGKSAEGKAATALGEAHGIQVGDWGIAVSPLRPAGKGRFGEEYVDIVADGAFVEQGSQVRVTDVSGNHIVVAAVEEKA